MESKINLNAERPSLDGRNLDQLIALYLTDTRLRGVQRKTVANYGYLLSHFREWWEDAGIGLDYRLDVRSWSLFDGWLQTQCTRGGNALAFSTRRACLGKCRQVLRWAYRLDYVDRDFADQLPRPKGEMLQRQGPGLAELRRLIDKAGPGRDRALVAVLAGTGIRRAEAAGVNVDDVAVHADGGGVIRIRRAKMDKPRRVVFESACGIHLIPYLGERLGGPLFVGWKGKRLSSHSVYRIVKEAMRRAGIDAPGRGPHDLRRSFATIWNRTQRGLGDGQLLSQQLGHSSQTMSAHYSGLNFDDLQEGFISPLSML